MPEGKVGPTQPASELGIRIEANQINPKALTPFENIAMGSGYPITIGDFVAQMTQADILERIAAGTYFINEDFFWPVGGSSGELTPAQILHQRHTFPAIKGLYALGLFEPEGAGDLIFDEGFEPEMRLTYYDPKHELTDRELEITFPNKDPKRVLTEKDIEKLNLRTNGDRLINLQKPTPDNPRAILGVQKSAMHGKNGEVKPVVESPIKEYPKITNEFLTLFESGFIGGSMKVDGKFYDTKTAVKEYIEGEGVLPEDWDQVPAQMDRVSSDLVDLHRSASYIVGPIGIFGKSNHDVLAAGYDLATKVPAADPETGIRPREWDLFLTTPRMGQSTNNPEVLSKLVPQGELSKILKVEPNGEGLHIRFKTWEEYNAA